MGLTRTLLAAGTGAALAYFLDPVSGKERRRRLRAAWEERLAVPVGSDTELVPPTVVEPPAHPPAHPTS